MVNKIVLIIGSLSAIILFGFLLLPISIPFLSEPVSSEQLTEISNILDIPEQELLDSQSSSLIYNYVRIDNEPDFLIPIIIDGSDEVVNNVEVSLDVLELEQVVPLSLELIRTITFDDGTTDIENINAFELNTVTVPLFDFVAINNDFRSIGNGKLELNVSVDIDNEIHQSQSKFIIKFDGKVIDTIDKTYSNSDVKNGKLVILDKLINLKPLLATKGNGVYTVEVIMDKFFIINTDHSRDYAEAVETIYTFDIEKSDVKSIKKDEHGNLSKVFDSDATISVSANAQSVGVTICLNNYKGGGCANTYSDSGTIPAPALGSVTITDVSTGKVVASKPPMGAGYCGRDQYGNTGFGYSTLSGALTQCGKGSAGGGGSLGFSAQRGESYRVTVSDPSASWVIDVPETGGAYNYSCVDAKSAVDTGQKSCSQHGGCRTIYSISSVRSCNFP